MIGPVTIYVTWLLLLVHRTISDTSLPPLVSDDELNGSGDIGDTMKLVSKRATSTFYNGVIERKFYTTFSYIRPMVPSTSLMAFGRPLQRGPNGIPQLNYIALWAPRGQSPHWGAVSVNAQGKLDATFVKDRRVYNLSNPAMQKTNVRLLQYIGTEEENNFRFGWTKAIDADMATVVSEKRAGLCNPRMSPAILQDQGFEYLGEADIDNRIMYYVDNGYVNTVQGELFTNNVHLLTKQQCQCSCPSTTY